MLSHLLHHPQWIVPLAELHAQAWSHLYTDWNVTTAAAEFRAQHTDGTLPATLLLLHDSQLVGSVSLVFDDLPDRPELQPWLASLFILREHRGQGHAATLIAAAVAFAGAARYPILHLFTENAATLFKRHGFIPMENITLQGHPIALLRRTLQL